MANHPSFDPKSFGRLLRGHTPVETSAPAIPRAAVLVPLYEEEGRYHVVLTARTSQVEHHKGEVSFPGGMREAEDSTLQATALRESYEEVGIQPQDVTVLGQMNDRVTRVGISITPFVGVIPPRYPFVIQEREVAELLQVSLEYLLDPANVSLGWDTLPDGRMIPPNSFWFGEHVIFGATAFILQDFLDRAFLS